MENKQIILHVGFHKSGSTFIQNYFENHPDVFFSREIVADFIKDLHADIPLFEKDIAYQYVFISDMRLTVNSWGQNELERIRNTKLSPNTELIQKTIAQKLKKRFNSAKILITVRDKEQLLFSLYSQYILNGGIKIFKHFARDSQFLNTLFNYEAVINMYAKLFGEENVHVVSYDILKEDPQRFIKEICAIDNFPFHKTPLHTMNAGLSMQSLKKRRLINIMVHGALLFLPKSKRNHYFKRYIHNLVSKNSN